jgi:hypothetical protein
MFSVTISVGSLNFYGDVCFTHVSVSVVACAV